MEDIMKSKMITMILFIVGLFVCVIPGITKDKKLLSSDKIYENSQSTTSIKTNVVVPVTESNGSSDKITYRLSSMKEFLKDVPSDDRLEFLDSLVLKNGHIVSAYIGPLKRTLNKERVDKILDAIFINRGLTTKLLFENPGLPARFVRLSTLLENLPVNIKNEFLDNMAFKDGAFASAYIGGLRKVLKDEKLKELLRSIVTNPSAVPKMDNPKALCFDGYCENAGCFTCGGGRWCCKDADMDSICDTSCK